MTPDFDEPVSFLPRRWTSFVPRSATLRLHGGVVSLLAGDDLLFSLSATQIHARDISTLNNGTSIGRDHLFWQVTADGHRYYIDFLPPAYISNAGSKTVTTYEEAILRRERVISGLESYAPPELPPHVTAGAWSSNWATTSSKLKGAQRSVALAIAVLAILLFLGGSIWALHVGLRR